MRRMVDRGLLTAKERQVLIQSPVVATQRLAFSSRQWQKDAGDSWSSQ
jgi:hypothetical protein